jgi:uncharacterized protein (DUF1330 family)
MAAYVMAHIEISDMETFRHYQRGAGAAITAAGGKVLAAGPLETLEGEAPGRYGVLLEFSSVKAASDFYDGDTYRTLIPVRQAAAPRTVITVVPGLDRR